MGRRIIAHIASLTSFARLVLRLLLELRSVLRGGKTIVDLTPDFSLHLVLVGVLVGVLVVNVVIAIVGASLADWLTTSVVVGVLLAELRLGLLLVNILIAVERIPNGAPHFSFVLVLVLVLVGVLVVDGRESVCGLTASFDTGDDHHGNSKGDLKVN